MLEAGIRSLSSRAFTITRAYSRPWICRPCRRAGTLPSARRGIATTARQDENRKPYYVTTPIFYVNAGKFHNPGVQGNFFTESNSLLFLRSTACRPSLHDDSRRYIEKMANPPRKLGLEATDGNGRAWVEGITIDIQTGEVLGTVIDTMFYRSSRQLWPINRSHKSSAIKTTRHSRY